jgi:hypothetical protein
VSDLLITDEVPGGLPELRERYREARSTFELDCLGEDDVERVLAFWALPGFPQGPLGERDLEPRGKTARARELRAIRASLDAVGIRGTLDAIRG